MRVVSKTRPVRIRAQIGDARFDSLDTPVNVGDTFEFSYDVKLVGASGAVTGTITVPVNVEIVELG